MSKSLFTSVLAIFLTVIIVIPSAFFIAPQKAHAFLGFGDIVWDPGNATFNAKTAIESTISVIKNTLIEVHAYTSMVAEIAQYVNTYVLQPLAFVLAGNLMKMLTAGVIAFVIGKANGTGVPQFVVDVQKSMQTVADGQALAYLNQIGNTRSPFTYSIASALNTDYLTKSSLAGFWAANMNNLAASSPNVPAYLSGNWSQGGIAAWFALTTQVQNNPYTLYQSTQSKLASVIGPGIGGATGARAAQLSWGSGFMSWCGASDVSAPAPESPVSKEEIAVCKTQHPTWDNIKCMEYVAQNRSYDAATAPTPAATGVNPGDPCTKKDGTPGTIQTPGSTIKSTLDKVLGGQQDQIVRMGNIGPEINGILGNIATVMDTVNFASQILGGGSSNGLLGVGNTSGSGSSSRLAQFQNAPGALGVTNAQIYQSAASNELSNGSSMTTQVAQYQAAWNTISVSANTASTSVASLANFCTTAADAAKTQLKLESDPNAQASLQAFITTSTAQATAAQGAITAEIAPVFSQAATAASNAAAATAMVQKLQADLSSAAGTTGTAYTADLKALQTMSPTNLDIANAQQEAQVFGTSVANPLGSLTVASTSSSIVDQMNLISTNAQALKASACTYHPPTGFFGG